MGEKRALWSVRGEMMFLKTWRCITAVGFIVQLVGLCALVLSVLVETPESPPQEHGKRERLAIAKE